VKTETLESKDGTKLFARIWRPDGPARAVVAKVTVPAGSQTFFDKAGSSDKTLKLCEGYAHDLLNDLGKEVVMKDIITWIDDRLPAARAALATP
jgi:acylglycerol lipase